MCDDHSHQRENTPDPLTEFLAQLLAEFPDVLSTPITTTTPTATASTTAPYHTPNPYFTCQWISPHDPPLVCDAPLSQDPKHTCHHFRHAHNICGNGKAHVLCHWRDCNAPPMLQGSLIRHVLAVHLRLLRWQCEVCGRVFSRKGTGHACVEGG